MLETEAMYMKADDVVKEALLLIGLVRELSVEQGGVRLNCESQSVIYLETTQVYHVTIKHIDVRFHKIRELFAAGQMLLEKFHILENALDM